MTVFEFFDYEKQLMADLKAVRTQTAKDAVYDSILKVLDEHRQFVVNTIRDFDMKVQEGSKRLVQAYNGETPDYVKTLMAEFGFYELEKAEDFGGYHTNVWDSRKLSDSRIKDLCSTEDDIGEEYKKDPDSGDENIDAQNAKIMSAADPNSENFGIDLTEMTAEEFLNGKSAKKMKAMGGKRGRKGGKAGKSK